MTSKERVTNILNHKPVDRMAIYEHFWSDTKKHWTDQGKISKDTDMGEHFGFDVSECWSFNMTIDIDWVKEKVSETEDTITLKDGNGAILKQHKHHDTTPEHIDFAIKEQEDWDKVKHKLTIDPRRINFDAYRKAKQAAKESEKFFCWSGVNVFELMHPVCGHENMLVGMILEPEWIAEMAEQFTDVTLGLMKILFEQEGYPDGIWFYEDMGFKLKPFMSPEKYRELIMPSHIRTCDYAHEHNMPVIMHSCGFIEPLLPHMIEAGIDCLQVIEVKAGMDLLKLYKEYGDKIAFMGGIDVRALYCNDKAVIDKELESKIPFVKEGFGYMIHSDHSIPKTVDYEIYKYFIEKGLELGTYKDFENT
ncbi:MAG: uroporphyrinogen decarboxylase family protein [Clostridia bacterium]